MGVRTYTSDNQSDQASELVATAHIHHNTKRLNARMQNVQKFMTLITILTQTNNTVRTNLLLSLAFT